MIQLITASSNLRHSARVTGTAFETGNTAHLQGQTFFRWCT